MISMVNFEFGIAEVLLAAKKESAKGGGFEEFLARTTAQLSGDSSTGENVAANDVKNKETKESVQSADGEKKGSGDETPEDHASAASTPMQALAAVLLAAPLPQQVQEVIAQDLTVGTKVNVQRAAAAEKPVPAHQAGITLKAPSAVQGGDAEKVSEASEASAASEASEAPEAPEASQVGADFKTVLSDAKIAQLHPQDMAVGLSPNKAEGAGEPQTHTSKEAEIRVTGAQHSLHEANKAQEAQTVTQTKDMEPSTDGARKLNLEARQNVSTLNQGVTDKESTGQKTSAHIAQTQPAGRSPVKAEKSQEKVQVTDTVEPMKFAAPVRVESPKPEAKAVELRQPAFEQVAKAVTKTAKSMTEDGSCTFDMKLFPEGLGKLEVRMTCEGKNLTLMVTAHSEEAAKLLTNGAEKLKNTLSENYEVTHLEIRTEIKTDTQSGTTFFANGFGGSGHYGDAYGAEQTRYVGNERDIDMEVASEQRIPVGILDARV